MICPACNYELAADQEACQNCGAPSYLVTAAQNTEIAHCTYCGTRNQIHESQCPHCGLNRNFRTLELGIGNCRNCGVLWRNTWFHCQTCGVPREYGLIDSVTPVAVQLHEEPVSRRKKNGQPQAKPATFSVPAAIDFFPDPDGVSESWLIDDEPEPDLAVSDFAAEDFASPPILSEHEVVGRMFISEETAGQFNGNYAPTYPAAIGQPTASAVIYDLAADANVPTPAPPVTKVTKALAQEAVRAAAAQTVVAAVAASPQPSVAVPNSPPPTPKSNTVFPAPPTPLPKPSVTAVNTLPVAPAPPPIVPVMPPVAAPPPLKISDEAQAKLSSPTQSVRVIHKPKYTTTPQVDKKLVRIIAALITLILLFAGLIVSGFRVRDLFTKIKTLPGTVKISTNTVAVTNVEAADAEAALAVPAGMVYVPGGVFTMGTDDVNNYEAPAHEVTVKAFFLDKTEVTNAQYAEFLQTTNHLAPANWVAGKFPQDEGQFPVTNISWHDANDYAQWAGKRLPSEAEWEYAARGNTQRRYPWGNEWNSTIANTEESNLKKTVAVGSYPQNASPFGILDLIGNVWEFVDGEMVSYKDQNVVLIAGAKIMRGGSFANPSTKTTATYRGYTMANQVSPILGFRCAKNVD